MRHVRAVNHPEDGPATIAIMARIGIIKNGLRVD
jgi:hypothetical protein